MFVIRLAICDLAFVTELPAILADITRHAHCRLT